MVHRDVTPHNVLLSFEGAVKLTDFGIAKATTSQTAPGMLKGKFAYMSPEQSKGEKVDARSDLFALGVVLWELLTGGRLFDGDSDLAVLRSVQDSLIAPPSRLNPDVPAELSDVVMKALARPLDERFQSAFELDRALANFVLRNAKSVEDTSVAIFLQHLFKEEFEAPSDAGRPDETQSDDGEFGSGETVARAPRYSRTDPTLTATPVDRTPQRGVMDDDDSDGRTTEEFGTRRSTEQMPAVRRPSRRLEPLAVQEPSVVLRESVRTLPEMSASPTRRSITQTATPQSVTVEASEATPKQSTLPRSNTPLIALLSVLIIGLLGGIGFVARRDEQAANTPVEPVAALSPKPEVIAPEVLAVPVPVPDPVPELDAGAALAVAPPEVKPPEPAKPAPVARRTGTIAVKAVPFATVTLQGKSYEVTGVKSFTVPAGTYELTLKHPRKQAKERVTVLPNQATPVTFSAD